jgi:hypothetical protein
VVQAGGFVAFAQVLVLMASAASRCLPPDGPVSGAGGTSKCLPPMSDSDGEGSVHVVVSRAKRPPIRSGRVGVWMLDGSHYKPAVGCAAAAPVPGAAAVRRCVVGVGVLSWRFAETGMNSEAHVESQVSSSSSSRAAAPPWGRVQYVIQQAVRGRGGAPCDNAAGWSRVRKHVP